MMKKLYGGFVAVCTALIATTVIAFQCPTSTVPSRILQQYQPYIQQTKIMNDNLLQMSQDNNQGEKQELNNNDHMFDAMKKLTLTTMMVTSIWGTTSSWLPQQQYETLVPFSYSTVASAKEMASGSGSRVNKDPESLLRYGLPIQNKEV
jgi:hypothetical protein